MDDEWAAFWVGVILTSVVWGGFVACKPPGREAMRSKAIERGAARYSPTTGEFEWVEREENDG